MSQVMRAVGPAAAEMVAAGVAETLVTPSISIVDRVGSLLIIGSIEVDPDAAASTILTPDLVVNGVPLGLSVSRVNSNPIAAEVVSVHFSHVIEAPAVGDTFQLEVLCSGASVVQQDRATLVVVALAPNAAEVAGLVSP